jgi:hypothetical protein
VNGAQARAMLAFGFAITGADGLSDAKLRLPGRKLDDLEKRFLAGLEGESLRIWARRIHRGLTSSERAFIAEQLGAAE